MVKEVEIQQAASGHHIVRLAGYSHYQWRCLMESDIVSDRIAE